MQVVTHIQTAEVIFDCLTLLSIFTCSSASLSASQHRHLLKRHQEGPCECVHVCVYIIDSL